MGDILDILGKLLPAPSSKAREFALPHYHAVRDEILRLRAELAERDKAVPEPVNDEDPVVQVGRIGDEIHNLGCDHQNDEDLSERLAMIATRLWRLQAMLTAAPAPSKPRGDSITGKSLWPDGPLTERVGNAELVCLANDPAPPRSESVVEVDKAMFDCAVEMQLDAAADAQAGATYKVPGWVNRVIAAGQAIGLRSEGGE